VNGAGIVVGDVLSFSFLVELEDGLDGLDWVWGCNAKRCETMRNDAKRFETNTTRGSGQYLVDER
jgi:hypothetical protein